MEKPRLKRTAEKVETPRGDLVYMRSGPTDVQIQRPDGLADLRERFGRKRVDEALAGLSEVGLLEDAADDDRLEPAALERFDRQLRTSAT